MTTELDKRLTDLRRAPHWSADGRALVLDQVLESDSAPQRADRQVVIPHARRRHYSIGIAVAAGLAAACIAVPTVLPAGTPGSADTAEAAAQALHRLAHIAAVSPTDTLGPNQYLHLVEVDEQKGSSGRGADDHRYEYWTRSDGLTYQRRTEDGGTEVWVSPPGPMVIDGMTVPVYLDRLPTDAAALEAYVRAHTSGSNSADERVFVAVVDIVRRGLAGPELRSAALEVLAGLGHVQLSGQKHDSQGDPVQAFNFVDPKTRANEVDSIMFDTRTAQIAEEQYYSQDKLVATRKLPTFEVVNSVPAAIRASATVQR